MKAPSLTRARFSRLTAAGRCRSTGSQSCPDHPGYRPEYRGRPTNAALSLPLERAQPSASAGLVAGVNQPGCVAVETHGERIETATVQPEGDFDVELFQRASDQLIAVNRSGSWLRSLLFWCRYRFRLLSNSSPRSYARRIIYCSGGDLFRSGGDRPHPFFLDVRNERSREPMVNE